MGYIYGYLAGDPYPIYIQVKMTLNKGPMANRANLYVIIGMKNMHQKPVIYTICGFDEENKKRYEFATILKHQGDLIGTSYQLCKKVCDVIIYEP